MMLKGTVAAALPMGPWTGGGTKVQTPDDVIQWRILLKCPCLLPLMVFRCITVLCGILLYQRCYGCRRWWCTFRVSTACVSGGPCPPLHMLCVAVCVYVWCVPGGDLPRTSCEMHATFAWGQAGAGGGGLLPAQGGAVSREEREGSGRWAPCKPCTTNEGVGR